LIRTRHNEQDGRSIVCELIPAGQELLKKARGAAALFIDAQLAPFEDAALRETETQMNRMRSHLQTIDPDAIFEQALKLRHATRKKAS
jgi:DNA-binding MarR family transcriptional regulator